MESPVERLGRSLFPALRPFWQQLWTGMLLGTVLSLIALALLAASR